MRGIREKAGMREQDAPWRGRTEKKTDREQSTVRNTREREEEDGETRRGRGDHSTVYSRDPEEENEEKSRSALI